MGEGLSELGLDLDLDPDPDPDPWKIFWIQIRQNDADPLDPDPDLQHCFKPSILLSSLYFIHLFLQNHPGGKYLVWRGIESIPSPKQQ